VSGNLKLPDRYSGWWIDSSLFNSGVRRLEVCMSDETITSNYSSSIPSKSKSARSASWLYALSPVSSPRRHLILS